jgi:hypothetical protein
MQQVIVLAAIGTVAYVAYRYLQKTLGAVSRWHGEPIRVKSVYLELGPDGVYRPTERVGRDRV